MTDKNENYYDILKVKRDCGLDELKRSYFELSKQYHPDKRSKTEYSHERFLSINEAYATLKNPLKRKQYDQYLSGKLGLKNYRYQNYHDYGSGFSSKFNSSYNGSFNGNNNIFKSPVVPKGLILAALISLTLVSGILEMFFIGKTSDRRRRILEKRSLMLSLLIEHAEQDARTYGNEKQIRRLQEGKLGRHNLNEILDKYLSKTYSESEGK